MQCKVIEKYSRPIEVPCEIQEGENKFCFCPQCALQWSLMIGSVCYYPETS